MELAPSIAPAVPTAASGRSDAVSPSRLFAFARDRFGIARDALRIGGPGSVPTGIVAALAIAEVGAGMRALRSAVVPATPFHQRQQALAALEQARAGAGFLQAYRDAVAALGDGPLRHDDLPVGALHQLSEGRDRLAHAIMRLA